MKQWIGILLLGGLAMAQAQVPYREVSVAAAALARLQAVAQQVTQGEAKILDWAKEVKARAEKSYEDKAYFRAAREAQAALALYRAALSQPVGTPKGGHPKRRWAPPMAGVHRGLGGPWGGYKGGPKGLNLVDRAEKEMAYYQAGDPLVKTLVDEAKARKEKEPLRAQLLARAALSLISAARGF